MCLRNLLEGLELAAAIIAFAIVAAPLLLLYAVGGRALEAEDELTRVMLEDELRRGS